MISESNLKFSFLVLGIWSLEFIWSLFLVSCILLQKGTSSTLTSSLLLGLGDGEAEGSLSSIWISGIELSVVGSGVDGAPSSLSVGVCDGVEGEDEIEPLLPSIIILLAIISVR